MPKLSAALLLYRIRNRQTEVLLVHPGGPFWTKRDDGAWSIPKGEYRVGEDPLTAAYREFHEELGHAAPPGEAVELGEIRQRGGKLVRAWAISGDLEVSPVASNSFEMEWPPRSGIHTEFPEVDRAEWFDLPNARAKLLPAQTEFLDTLEARLTGLEPA